MQLAAAPGWLAGTHGDLGVQPEIGGEGPDRAVDRGQVGIGGAAEQGPEDQPAPDHHLLDVQHAELVGGQRREQA